jgi:hypothetical protein
MWCSRHYFQTIYYNFEASTLNLIQIWRHVLHSIHIWDQSRKWTKTFTSKLTSRQANILIRRVIKINKGWWKEMWKWNWHFLLHNKSFGNHIHHICNCPWGEDCALKTLYQIVANNLIPPCLDILMDPIRIWNRLLVY